MSTYTYIKGIADIEKLEKAKQVKENLNTLNIECPAEIYDICDNNIKIPHKEFTEYDSEIIEIDIKDIPKEVKKIQFIISY